jgi:N-acetylmuramoyl-L-alanine amidase CwlA
MDQFYSSKYIAGTVKNNTNKQYSYVQVEINLYDDAGNQVGSTLANANNLEPGGTWKFKAPIIEEKATKYKVKDVTGF